MLEQTDLEWLARERPDNVRLDEAATARVRAELLSYAAAGGAGRRRPRRRPALRARAARVAVGSAVLAGGLTVALLATQPAAGNHAGGPLSAVSVQSASAKQLSHLTARLASAPAPTGDATLVLRTQTNQQYGTENSAELFTDNGNDYWAPTQADLASVIKAGQTVNQNSADEESREVAVAKSALSEPVAQADQQMSTANLDPNINQATLAARSSAIFKAKLAAMSAAQRAKLQAAEAQTQSLIGHTDDMIWNNAMDAMMAGGGDPQVRAGALEILGSLPEIKITNGTLNGQDTLVLTAQIFQQGSNTYQEQWTVNAQTGDPLAFAGGNVGQAPDATATYTISRVTTSQIENASPTS